MFSAPPLSNSVNAIFLYSVLHSVLVSLPHVFRIMVATEVNASQDINVIDFSNRGFYEEYSLEVQVDNHNQPRTRCHICGL